MADSKITALTALTAADPANDMLPVVDVSDTSMAASGTTKRISINNILACSPSATLASATITGDLTVRTNKLAVTSSGVGFGTTTPAYPAHFRTTSPVIAIQDDTSAATGVGGVMNFLGFTSGTSGANIFAQIKGVKTAGSAGGEYQVFTSDSAGNSIQRYLIDSTGISTWSVAGTTAMTLNSTGLGVGGSPNTGLLTVGATTNASATANALTILSQRATFVVTANGATDAAGTTINYAWANGGQGPLIFRNAAISNVLTLDSSGNVGIGVTPSAWNTSFKAIELLGGNINTSSTANIRVVQNAVYTSSQFVYKTAGLAATSYSQSAGAHTFFNAPVGANANDPIIFSPAMTLDASGNLILLSSNTPATLTTNGQLTVNATSNTNLRFSYRGSDGTTRVANITLA